MQQPDVFMDVSKPHNRPSSSAGFNEEVFLADLPDLTQIPMRDSVKKRSKSASVMPSISNIIFTGPPSPVAYSETSKEVEEAARLLMQHSSNAFRISETRSPSLSSTTSSAALKQDSDDEFMPAAKIARTRRNQNKTRQTSGSSRRSVSSTSNASGTAAATVSSDKKGAECSWPECEKDCPHTDDTPYRKVVSDCFGRNVSALREEVPWVYVCRRRYQRQKYAGPQSAMQLRAIMFVKQLELWQRWGGFRDFEIQDPPEMAGGMQLDELLAWARNMRHRVCDLNEAFPVVKAFPRLSRASRDDDTNMQ